MVDRDSVTVQLARLARLMEQLDQARLRGSAVYLSDGDLRAATERRLQLAEQICIDVGAHVLSETNARPPADYSDIFVSLADAGVIDRELASQMVLLARQRDVLVQSYLEVDDEIILESLEHLGDMRAFAAAIQRILDLDSQ